MAGNYEKFTPVIQLDEITTAEENLLADLASAGFQEGDLIIYSGGHLIRLGIGSSGQFLMVSGGLPAWISQTALGDVVGPSSSTDNYLVRFDGATGKLIQLASILVDDNGNLFMGNATKIDFGTSDITLTHSANLLTLAGGDLTINGAVILTGQLTISAALTGVLRADAGVVSVDSDVTDLVSAASDVLAGKVELATTAETSAGTDATRAVTPDGLSQSVFGGKYATFMLFESNVSASVGDGIGAFTIPADFNGMNLVAAIASVHTKGITDTTDIQIRRRRAGVNADMLGTKITIGDEFFAADGVIDGANDDVITGDQIYCDVDAVHSGTAPLGLTVCLTFRLP